MKIPSLYPKNIPAILCTTDWRLERLPLGLLTKNSTQSTSVLPFCHIRAYWKRTASEPETVPPPDSQASAGLSQRQVPVFVPVPVSRCHTEARRHCFRASAGGQGFSLSLSRWGCFSADHTAQPREGSLEKAEGKAPNKACRRLNSRMER